MPRFTVRVELHAADWDDYETLHAAMEDAGFSRQIESTDGKTYALPTAEYIGSGELTKEEVLSAARSAATKTRKTYSVLVTESVGRKWYGLQPV